MKKILLIALAALPLVSVGQVPQRSVEMSNFRQLSAPAPMRVAALEADNPAPLENVVATLSADYKHVTLSWSPASEVGESGGTVDVNKVVYYIFDAFGSYYDPAIATTTETSITFDYSDLVGQDFVAYQVTAGVDETYYSLATTSNVVVVGEPAAAPLFEGFADAQLQQQWFANSDGYVVATMVKDNEISVDLDSSESAYLNSAEGDNGLLMVVPMEENASMILMSTKTALAGASDPVLEFKYQGKGGVVNVYATADGADYQLVHSVNLLESPAEAWALCRVDLSAFADKPFVQFYLEVVGAHNTADHAYRVCLDDIRLRQLAEDVRITHITAPARVAAGESFTATVSVQNIGTKASQHTHVFLFDQLGFAGEQITESFAPEQTMQFTYEVPAGVTAINGLELSASLLLYGDEYNVNNQLTKHVDVAMPQWPAAEGLTATDLGDYKVALAWQAPQFDATAAVRRVEDFEDSQYELFTISNFGGWTLVDRDGKKTYTFLRDTNNPNRTKPQAFVLFDPVAAGVPTESLIDVPTHSGDRMLMAFSAQGQNDNWLISPQLSGEAQTVAFFAKSFTIAYPESFEVLYSTTDTDPDSFVKIDAVDNYPADNRVSEDWTEYRAALPAGARYFAVRHTADDTYALMLDDFTFDAAPMLPADLQVLGYNIYRDGQLLNAQPVAELTYTDTPGWYGTYSYQVSVVYNHGESAATQPVAIELKKDDGIADATADDVEITAAAGIVTVTAPAPIEVEITNIAGVVLYRATAATHRVPLPSGLYIARAATRATTLRL
ncbi:MAG: choice-of-anchor J domain-containing protein [Muribaculaceae bacterium]